VIADVRPAPVVISDHADAPDLIGLPDPCEHSDDFAGPLDAMLSSFHTSAPTAFVLASNDVDLEALLQ
jgi:hypothetical protein